MTDDSKRFLDPEIVARVSHLEVRAREIVEGLLTGRHKSPFYGSSIEFREHRGYVAGDDLRKIDWKVWAKSDRYQIKQYEDETNLCATLIVDASESMAYGEGELNKFEFASTLAATIGLLLLQQGDSVGLVTFDEKLSAQVAPRTQPTHIRKLLQGLASVSPTRTTQLPAVLNQVVDILRRRGMVLIFSDLLVDADQLRKSLSIYRRKKFDVIVVQILHDEEIDFPFEGATRFEGLESLGELTCDPKALRKEYQANLELFLTRLRHDCGSLGVEYRLARTSQPIAGVIASIFAQRAGS